MKNWFLHASNCWKWLTSAINRAFSVQYACGLLTTPTLLVCADMTAHARTQYRKGFQVIIRGPAWSVAIVHYSGYGVHGVCALESSS